MQIYYSSRFKKSYKNLDTSLKIIAKEKIKALQKNCFNPCLKTHKLKGARFYACSVDYDNRIIFEFIEKDKILLINIGDHSIYRKLK